MAGEPGLRQRYVTVEPILFLYMLAMYITIPADQQMTFIKFCRRNYSNYSAVCNNNTITGSNVHLQTDTAHLGIYTTTATIVPLILSCTFLGAWSDKSSRKWPQLMPLLGPILANGFNALLAAYTDWHPAFIIASAVVASASGYFVGIMLTACSYLTAVAPKDKFTFRLAVLEAALALGVAAGSLVSGVVLDKLGFMWSYVIALSLYSLAALYLVLLLPNVKPPATEKAQVRRYALFSCSTIVDYATCIVKKRVNYERMYLHLALASFFCGVCTVVGATQELFLFLTKVHKFSSSLYGLYAGLDTGFKLTVGVAVLWLVRTRLKWGNLSAAMLGCSSGVLGYGLVSIAVNDVMLWLAPVINSLNFFYSVTLRSFVAELIPPGEQGRIFAFMGAGQSIVTFLSSVLFNFVYPLSLSFYPGLCFLMASFFSLIAFSILAFLNVHYNRYSSYEEIPNIS